MSKKGLMREIDEVITRHLCAKTFSQHDFTAYNPQTIKNCIDLLDGVRTDGSLPAPLAVVYKALEKAQRTNPLPAKLLTPDEQAALSFKPVPAPRLRDLIKGLDK